MNYMGFKREINLFLYLGTQRVKRYLNLAGRPLKIARRRIL